MNQEDLHFQMNVFTAIHEWLIEYQHFTNAYIWIGDICMFK